MPAVLEPAGALADDGAMDDDRFYEPALAQGLAVALEHCPDAVAAAFALVIRQRAILGVCTDPAIEPFVLDPAR